MWKWARLMIGLPCCKQTSMIVDNPWCVDVLPIRNKQRELSLQTIEHQQKRGWNYPIKTKANDGRYHLEQTCQDPAWNPKHGTFANHGRIPPGVNIHLQWGLFLSHVRNTQESSHTHEKNPYYTNPYLSYLCKQYVLICKIYIYTRIYIYRYAVTTFKHTDFVNIQTGILDYLWESFPWSARPVKHTETNSIKHTVATFKDTKWYFILTLGPLGRARPPHI